MLDVRRVPERARRTAREIVLRLVPLVGRRLDLLLVRPRAAHGPLHLRPSPLLLWTPPAPLPDPLVALPVLKPSAAVLLQRLDLAPPHVDPPRPRVVDERARRLPARAAHLERVRLVARARLGEVQAERGMAVRCEERDDLVRLQVGRERAEPDGRRRARGGSESRGGRTRWCGAEGAVERRGRRAGGRARGRAAGGRRGRRAEVDVRRPDEAAVEARLVGGLDVARGEVRRRARKRDGGRRAGEARARLGRCHDKPATAAPRQDQQRTSGKAS